MKNTSAKPIRRRKSADNDLQDILDYYILEESPDAAMRFLDALEQAIIQISCQPSAGSPRYGHELDIPELRSLLVPRFPYIVFYSEAQAHVEIWRILHSHRDIPAWLE